VVTETAGANPKGLAHRSRAGEFARPGGAFPHSHNFYYGKIPLIFQGIMLQSRVEEEAPVSPIRLNRSTRPNWSPRGEGGRGSR
jgi:hypothetical protein